MSTLSSRRRFLGYLAASPLLAADSGVAPATPEAAINVFDFEAAARSVLPPAHFGYMATGVDGDRTLAANRAAFDRFVLRPRRLVDVTQVETGIELLGVHWETPVILAPCAAQKAFHPLGEIASARAGASRKTLQVLSTAATTGVEDVSKAATRPIWYQLYATTKWDVTTRLVARAEAAGCPVLVVTVDLPAGRNAETATRSTAMDKRVLYELPWPAWPPRPHLQFLPAQTHVRRNRR